MKKVYATIWYHPARKWKLDEAIIVENGKTIGWCVGGSFLFGNRRIKEKVLKEALLNLLFFNPEKDEEKMEEELKRIYKEVEIKFVSHEKLEKLKKKYPEDEK